MAGGLNTSGDTSLTLRHMVAVIVLAVTAGVGLMWQLSRSASPEPSREQEQEVIVVSARPVTPAPPPADPVTAHGAVINYELLGLHGDVALIAPHGEAPRPYRVGDRIGSDLTLIEVRRGSVRLRSGDRIDRLNLPPRLGGSAEAVPPGKQGLMPEPQPPSGEASGETIARRLAEANGAASPSAADDPAR